MSRRREAAMHPPGLLAVCLLAALFLHDEAWASSARFERLAQLGDLAAPIEGETDFVAIPFPVAGSVSVDDNGTVAFGTRGGLFVFEESLRTITFSDSTLANFEPSSTSISGSRVAMRAGVYGGSPGIIFFGDRISVHGEEVSFLPLTSGLDLGPPSLDPMGRVAYRIALEPIEIGSERQYPIEIQIWDGGDPRTLLSGDQEQGNNFGDPTWNASGQLALIRRIEDVQDLIRVEADGAITVIADETDVGCTPMLGCWFRALDIDDTGSVAFIVILDRPDGVRVHRLLRGDGQGGLVLIADSSGPIESFGRVRTNGAGDVVFEADLDDGRKGLLIGPNVDTDLIIATQDSLFGSGVSTLDLGGIDGQDRVAFHASTNDGRSLVARTVPEPAEGGALALLVLAGLGFAGRATREPAPKRETQPCLSPTRLNRSPESS